MLTIHHLNNSRSHRIIWLLEELGLPYEIKCYERDPKTMFAPPELQKLHPLGKSPVLTDGDRTVAESGAIIEYLLKRHGKGKLRPVEGSDEELRFTYWLHYAEGTLMPPLLVSLIFAQISKAPMPFFARPIADKIVATIKTRYIRPQLELNLDFIESELSRFAWFAGAEFSAADIQMSFPLEAAMSRGGTERRPHITNFLKKIHARDAYVAAIKRGGEFSILS